MFGERNPQSAAEEFAPPPQGENVLDASMMAELIVTNKEIGPQLKKSTRNLARLTEKPRCGQSTIAIGGKTWGRAFYDFGSWVWGRSWRRGSLPQFGRRLKGRSGRTRRGGYGSIKAIRKTGGCSKSARVAITLRSILLAGNSYKRWWTLTLVSRIIST